MYHRYIEYKNLISNILKYELMDEYLCLTNFDNQYFSLKDIVNVYLEKIYINVDDKLFLISRNPLKIR